MQLCLLALILRNHPQPPISIGFSIRLRQQV